jgi:hypothetical protein
VLSLVLCGAKQTSKGLVQRFGVLFGCQARIRCGFPVKKSISVRTRIQVGRAGCGQFRVRCCAGAVAVLNKQARVCKGLVLCAVRCGCKDAGLSQSKV